MGDKASIYRNPEDMSDSEEDVHPNICARSYHRFRREERKLRLEELRSLEKSGRLTQEEEKEKRELEYKSLPIAREIPEDSFKIAGENEPTDYSEELIWLLNNRDISCFMKLLDEKSINMNDLEDLIYYNLSNAIKEGEDDMGYEFCRLSLMVRWTKAYGRQYLLRMMDLGEDKFTEAYNSQYEESKKAILELNKK